MAVSKFLLDEFEEMVVVRGELVALQLLSTIKKVTSPFSFQSNKHFLKFPRKPFI
jgi:hypothetical protein